MNIYLETNKFLEQCFHDLEATIPSPLIVKIDGNKSLKYQNPNLETAIIQKLARQLSGLNASLQLLLQGYTQEVGALFRMLDEFLEDIIFLGLPLTGGEHSKLHDEYLQYFTQEEFDIPNDALSSTQNRPTIKRKKIIAAISNCKMNALNPSDSNNVHRTVSQAYSGYVHGASEHILEMVSGPPFKYNLYGMNRTQRQDDFIYNYWDYAYRGIISMMFSAKALGSKEVLDACVLYRAKFEELTGDSGRGDPEKLMRKIKDKYDK